jgi:tRNA pseudouridine32 synthase/23S rRNA pseudouridine746 synthase
MPRMHTQHFSHRCLGGETAIDVLATISQLPKQRLKDAMNKGAVWLKRGKVNKRLRRATTTLQAGDELSLHYNADILAMAPPAPRVIGDNKHYSVWHKPVGLLAQGTLEGDHCSLLRMAEQQLGREVYLVHRLDREAEGLMLIAHTGKAAAALSALFASAQGIRKEYEIEVRGEVPASGSIDTPLDGKDALTRYRRIDYKPDSDSSLVTVELITGRKHQIRRHFADIGHPVLGDPQYGKGNKDARGLQLRAARLAFSCPLTGKERNYSLTA